MTMWSDKLIRTALQAPFPQQLIAYVPGERADFGAIEDGQIQPASLDVRLGPNFIDVANDVEINVAPDGHLNMGPGSCVLASLVERVCIPHDVVARVEGKSSWARKFLTVHSAGFIDPGFHGDVTLELKNDGPLELYLPVGATIAQISFQWLAARAERPYGHPEIGSHYQGQTGPRRAAE